MLPVNRINNSLQYSTATTTTNTTTTTTATRNRELARLTQTSTELKVEVTAKFFRIKSSAISNLNSSQAPSVSQSFCCE